MWQQIESNKRKTIILIIMMALVLGFLGYGIAFIYMPEEDAYWGIIVAFVVWLIMFLTSYFKGDKIFLNMNHARPITHTMNPKLYNIVEEMTLAAGLPKMPQIYVIDDRSPNAFATGRNPEKASIAVTTGLLEILNRDELQGVIAHELAHIKNRDTLYMLFAGIMLSSIVLISEMFFRSRFRGRRSSSSRNGVEVFVFLIALIFVILAPILARLIYYSISRKREYLADACAAQFTRYPQGLASALQKISGTTIQYKSANRFTAPMYIINPLSFNKKRLQLNDMTSTHPATTKRIEILHKMAGADVVAYNNSYSQVMNKKCNLFSKKLLNQTNSIALVAPQSEIVSGAETEVGVAMMPETVSLALQGTPVEVKPSTRCKIVRRRETEDMMAKLEDYSFYECECGTKIKTPPCYKGQEIICPHCKKPFIA